MPDIAGIPREHAWIVGEDRAISLERPAVMGILNLTPDSFSDGGEYPDTGAAAEAGLAMLRSGARILDVGGESTRPGGVRVPADEQIRRIGAVIARIREDSQWSGGWALSVDTTLAEVAQAALDLGATIVNDVSAGTEDAGMFALAARSRCGLVLMHRRAPPGADSYSDRYASAPDYGGDVVASVRDFLEGRLIACAEAGIELERVAIDPGLGFGKTVEQNLELIARTGELRTLHRPVVSALSRKSFVGRAMGLNESFPRERETGTVALTVLHRVCGASIFRVHDVPAAVAALNCVDAAQ
jgi:dihydropteroate synthase